MHASSIHHVSQPKLLESQFHYILLFGYIGQTCRNKGKTLRTSRIKWLLTVNACFRVTKKITKLNVCY